MMIMAKRDDGGIKKPGEHDNDKDQDKNNDDDNNVANCDDNNAIDDNDEGEFNKPSEDRSKFIMKCR